MNGEASPRLGYLVPEDCLVLPEKPPTSSVLTWHTKPGQPVLDMGYLGVQTSKALDVRADSKVHLPQHCGASENQLLSTRPVISGPPEKILFKAERIGQDFTSKLPVYVTCDARLYVFFQGVISVAALSTLTRHTSGHSPSSRCIKGAPFYYTRNASSSACQLVGREYGKNKGEKHRDRKQHCRRK